MTETELAALARKQQMERQSQMVKASVGGPAATQSDPFSPLDSPGGAGPGPSPELGGGLRAALESAASADSIAKPVAERSSSLEDSSFTAGLKANFLDGICSDSSAFDSCSDASELASPVADAPVVAKKKPAKQSTFSAVASSTFNHRSTSDEAARILERWQSWDIGYVRDMLKKMDPEEHKQLAMDFGLKTADVSWAQCCPPDGSSQAIIEGLLSALERQPAKAAAASSAKGPGVTRSDPFSPIDSPAANLSSIGSDRLIGLAPKAPPAISPSSSDSFTDSMPTDSFVREAARRQILPTEEDSPQQPAESPQQPAQAQAAEEPVTEEQEEEDRVFAQFADASPQPFVRAPAPTPSPVPDMSGVEMVAPSPTLLPRKARGFSPPQLEQCRTALAQESAQAKLFAFGVKHGETAPDLSSVPQRSQDSLDMSNLAGMLNKMSLDSPVAPDAAAATAAPPAIDAVAPPPIVGSDEAEQARIERLDKLSPHTMERGDAEDDVEAEAQLGELSQLDELLTFEPSLTREDQDGVATQLEAEPVAVAEESASGKQATCAWDSMTADPGSPAQASGPDPFSGIFTPEAKSMAAIAEAKQQSPTPAVAAPRLEVFDQPDVQTPGGTYIWSEGSSTPTPVKAAARERIPKKSPFKVDFDGNVPYSASRPFQVDFVSNLPAGVNAGSVWTEKLARDAARVSVEREVEEICCLMSQSMRCGVPELGAVISVLKRAKPLQLEPAVGPLYQALRKHAKALHAARRSGVAVPSHKPAAKTMALSAPSTTQSALEQLADVACAGQWLISDQ